MLLGLFEKKRECGDSCSDQHVGGPVLLEKLGQLVGHVAQAVVANRDAHVVERGSGALTDLEVDGALLGGVDGRVILDATVNGALQVFPKAEFASLFR